MIGAAKPKAVGPPAFAAPPFAGSRLFAASAASPAPSVWRPRMGPEPPRVARSPLGRPPASAYKARSPVTDLLSLMVLLTAMAAPQASAASLPPLQQRWRGNGWQAAGAHARAPPPQPHPLRPPQGLTFEASGPLPQHEFTPFGLNRDCLSRSRVLLPSQRRRAPPRRWSTASRKAGLSRTRQAEGTTRPSAGGVLETVQMPKEHELDNMTSMLPQLEALSLDGPASTRASLHAKCKRVRGCPVSTRRPRPLYPTLDRPLAGSSCLLSGRRTTSRPLHMAALGPLPQYQMLRPPSAEYPYPSMDPHHAQQQSSMMFTHPCDKAPVGMKSTPSSASPLRPGGCTMHPPPWPPSRPAELSHFRWQPAMGVGCQPSGHAFLHPRTRGLMPRCVFTLRCVTKQGIMEVGVPRARCRWSLTGPQDAAKDVSAGGGRSPWRAPC